MEENKSEKFAKPHNHLFSAVSVTYLLTRKRNVQNSSNEQFVLFLWGFVPMNEVRNPTNAIKL